MQENPGNSNLIRINNTDRAKKFADGVKKSVIFTLSGVSGAGKSKVLSGIFEIFGDEFVTPIALTTRQQREGEINGVNYHFISDEEFRKIQERGEILVGLEQRGNFYGYTKSEFERVKSLGKIMLVDIAPKTSRELKLKMSGTENEVFNIFLEAPNNFSRLRRFVGRDKPVIFGENGEILRDEKGKKLRPEDFLKRLEEARIRREEFNNGVANYEAVLTNGKLEETIETLRKLCMDVIDGKLEIEKS